MSVASSARRRYLQAHMAVAALLVAVAVTHAGALEPCGTHASFEVTADGGTNFEARLHIARWQVGRTVALNFGANAVKVRATSVTGGATFSEERSHATFYLGVMKGKSGSTTTSSGNFPPGVITFRADGLPSSQPVITCDLDPTIAAYSPSPPPPPPHCAASFMYRGGRRWNGGFEALIDVGNGGVAPGFAVRVDFKQQTGLELLAADGASFISYEAPYLLLRPTLKDGKGTITLRMRGGGGGSPQVLCVPAPPAPPPPPLACGLGATWQATETLKEGKRYGASVSFDSWKPGVQVTLALGVGREVVSVSSSAVLIASAAAGQEVAGSAEGSGVAAVELLERVGGNAGGGRRGAFKLVYSGSCSPSLTHRLWLCAFLSASRSPPH